MVSKKQLKCILFSIFSVGTKTRLQHIGEVRFLYCPYLFSFFVSVEKLSAIKEDTLLKNVLETSASGF